MAFIACRVGKGLRFESPKEPALLGDREGYLEALRSYMKAGRDAALEIRRGAA